MLRAKNRRILTNQGPILAFVYPWYTNIEHNGKKDYINSLTPTRLFKIYTHNTHTEANFGCHNEGVGFKKSPPVNTYSLV